MGGPWHISTFAVFIKVLTDLIVREGVCGWVGVSYHSNFYMAYLRPNSPLPSEEPTCMG